VASSFYEQMFVFSSQIVRQNSTKKQVPDPIGNLPDVMCMAAKAYILCDVLKFSTEIFSAPIQESLFEHEGEPEIKIQLAKRDFYNGFDLYRCHHDFKIKMHGKAFYKFFSYFFRPVDFSLFYNPKIKIALMSVNSKIGLDFIQKLNNFNHHELNPIEVDFNYILPKITEMTGVWVSRINHANLKSAGYFGHHVDKSKEVEEAIKDGVLSSVLIKYISPTTKEEHTILISKKGTITLYDTYNQIEDELDLVMSVYNDIIKKPAI